MGKTIDKVFWKNDVEMGGQEDGRWMEPARYRVQWLALILLVLNLFVLKRNVIYFCLGVTDQDELNN